MRRAKNAAQFRLISIGSWIDLNGAVMWCHSRTLCGVACHSSPGATESALGIECLDAFLDLDPVFDVLLDASGISTIDPVAMDALLGWLRSRITELQARVGQRFVVLPKGLPGLALAGLGHVFSGPGPEVVVADARAGLRRLLPDGGDALDVELGAILRSLHATPPWLVELRALLVSANGATSLVVAARRLGISTRSLQRSLGEQGARIVESSRMRASSPPGSCSTPT